MQPYVLMVVATVCLLVAAYQVRRADGLVDVLLQRDEEQRQSRAELVEVFLADARIVEDRVAAERAGWRDERAELLNAILTLPSGQPQTISPEWSTDPTERHYHTEEDEVTEARGRVASRIEEELEHRIQLGPDMGSAA